MALSDILTKEQIDSLYAAGYSIIARDRFDIPAALIKPDWSYQWNEKPGDDWYWVKYEDHPGWFAPPDTVGPITLGGLGLFRKHKSKVDNTPEHARKRALHQLEDWADRHGMFTGGATILQTGGEEVQRTTVTVGKGVETKVETYDRTETKTVELVSKIPQDMIPHIDAVFAERDRIRDEIVQPDRTLKPHPITERFYEAIDADKGAPWWPTLNAIILPSAIENVRANLKETTS